MGPRGIDIGLRVEKHGLRHLGHSRKPITGLSPLVNGAHGPIRKVSGGNIDDIEIWARSMSVDTAGDGISDSIENSSFK